MFPCTLRRKGNYDKKMIEFHKQFKGFPRPGKGLNRSRTYCQTNAFRYILRQGILAPQAGISAFRVFHRV